MRLILLLFAGVLLIAAMERVYLTDQDDEPLNNYSESGDDEPRMSGGSELANLAVAVLPNPKDVVDNCVYYLPKTKYNRPPSKAPNKDFHFFFDLEDTIYTRRKIQIRKYEYLTRFLEKQMKIHNAAEIEDLILKQKKKLNQMLELHKIELRDPYTFMKPDDQVTELISSIKASRWIFTKSSLYGQSIIIPY